MPPPESSLLLVTGPDRQSAVEEQEDLVLSLVDVERDSAALRGVASHDQYLAVADGRVHQDFQGRAAHPGQLLVLGGGGEIGAQVYGVTLRACLKLTCTSSDVGIMLLVWPLSWRSMSRCWRRS